jgi:hypothetical protein
MHSYQAFGGTLHSEITFPELQPSTNSECPDWRLRVSASAPNAPQVDAGELEFLGEDRVDVNVLVRSYKAPRGYRLAYEDTGTFHISSDGCDILWERGAEGSLDAARLDILGRVLAVALHVRGQLALHGSGVAIGQQGVGFLAPKFSGKSTLALALVNAGAHLLSDDTLPIDVEGMPHAWPGIHSARVFQDSAQRLELAAAVAEPSFVVKHTLSKHTAVRVAEHPVALAALYLLVPIAAEQASTAVARARLSPLAATLELVSHAKVGALLGRSEAGSVLDRASTLASRVPVYRLDVVRDFAQLDAVVAQLISWHSDP